MPPASPRERVAVIRALLAAVDAVLDMIGQAIAGTVGADKPAHDWEWLDTVCPECGIKWRCVSPDCPRYIYNRDPLG
jgi:hypothetical protein